MVAQISELKSKRLRSSNARIGATRANSISALPASLASQWNLIPMRHLCASLAAARRKVLSPDKAHRADGICWKVEACRSAAALRQHVGGAVYRNVVDNECEAGGAVVRLADGAAPRHARMRQIDQAGDVPGRRVARGGDVQSRGQ